MPTGLVRYQHTGHFHFLTFSCYRRQPFFRFPKGRSLFERSLETLRTRYGFVVAGYVVMPEHVHLLVSEPQTTVLSRAVQALKLSVSVQSRQRPFWQARYYDFNVYTPHKRSEKIEYMHQNPVRRGLVNKPSEWLWSSYRHYEMGERIVMLLTILTLTINGCHNPEVVWSAESKSPDGKMIVTAKAFANEGGGFGGAPGTFVYLNWATGSQKPREILELSEDVVGTSAQSIEFHWVSPQRLELDYQSDKQEIQFQAVRFAGVEINVQTTAANAQPTSR